MSLVDFPRSPPSAAYAVFEVFFVRMRHIVLFICLKVLMWRGREGSVWGGGG